MQRLVIFAAAVIFATAQFGFSQEEKREAERPQAQTERLRFQAENKVAPGQPAERKVEEAKPANVKVTQVPGGGIQVIIRESDEDRAGNAALMQLQTRLRQLTDGTQQSQSRSSMRERIKQQHELTKKATKLMKKIDELGEGNKNKAHELWEELEQVEAKLRQTFGPTQMSIAPGQSIPGWTVQPRVQMQQPVPLPGAPLNNAPRAGTPGAPLNPNPGTANPAPTNPYTTAPNFQGELQSLRRQLEELRTQMQKLNEKK